MDRLPTNKGRKGQCQCGHMKRDHLSYMDDIDTIVGQRREQVWRKCDKCDCQRYHQNRIVKNRHMHGRDVYKLWG